MDKEIQICAECGEEIRQLKAGDDSLNYCGSCQQIEPTTKWVSIEEYEAGLQ